jgi:hypothetical protein
LAAAAIGLALLLEAFPAAAQQYSATAPTEPDALTILLPPEKGRSLCYISSGPPVAFPLEAHRAGEKPRTIEIKRFLFRVRSDKFDDDDTTTPPTPGDFYYGYRIVAEVVGTRGKLLSAGQCGSASTDVFGCGSDCDGGTMAFKPIAGSDALSMQVSDVSHRFRMSWGCGGGGAEGGGVEVLRYDPATPVVRMERAPAKMCSPIGRVFRRSK